MIKIRNISSFWAAMLLLPIVSILSMSATFAQSAPTTQSSSLPPSAANSPDLQVLVMAGVAGAQTVNLTYGSAVSASQVAADLSALARQLPVDVANAQISNSALPVPGIQTPVMTSVTASIGATAGQMTGTLPLSSIVIGLRRYHRLEITFIMPPGFTYVGSRQYKDSDVAIDSTQNGSSYVFNVTISNSNMTALNLPVPMQAGSQPMAQTTNEPSENERNRLRTVLVVLLVCAAILIGIAVYFVTSHLQKQAKSIAKIRQ